MDNTLACLDISDTRLRMPVSDVKLSDPHCRLAISVLQTLLHGHENRALSAPSVGIAMRIIALRLNGKTLCLLNPKIHAAGPSHERRGFLNIHMPRIALSAFVPQTLELDAMTPDGRSQIIEVPPEAIYDVVQAFMFFDSIDPFAWMTPFHKLWLGARQSAGVRMFENLSIAFAQAPEASLHPTHQIRRSQNIVTAYRENGQKLTEFDANSPSFPVQHFDQILAGLIVRFGVVHNCYYSGAKLLAVAIACALQSGGAPCYFDQSRSEPSITSALGVHAYIQHTTMTLQNLDPALVGQKKFGTVVVDMRGMDPTRIIKLPLKKIAIATDSNGACLILVDAKTVAIETELQKHFAELYRFDTASNDKIYVARKREIPIDAQRAKTLFFAMRLGVSCDHPQLFPNGVRLQKDGKEVAL